jgi:hypothetical protein
MGERLQKALDDVAAVAQQSRQLSVDEQDVIAARLETMASELHWELLFHTPEDELTGASGLLPTAHEDSATPASVM